MIGAEWNGTDLEPRRRGLLRLAERHLDFAVLGGREAAHLNSVRSCESEPQWAGVARLRKAPQSVRKGDEGETCLCLCCVCVDVSVRVRVRACLARTVPMDLYGVWAALARTKDEISSAVDATVFIDAADLSPEVACLWTQIRTQKPAFVRER